MSKPLQEMVDEKKRKDWFRAFDRCLDVVDGEEPMLNDIIHTPCEVVTDEEYMYEVYEAWENQR